MNENKFPAWTQSIYSDGSKYFVSNPLPVKGEEITLSIQFSEKAPVTNVFFKGKINGIDHPRKMEKCGVKNGLVRYEIKVKVWGDELSYQFWLLTKDCIYYYTQKGLYTAIPGEDGNFRIITDYQQPQWVKSAVFYQIFPERFCNGNPENDVKDGEYQFDGHPAIKVKDWNSVPEDYNKAYCLDFYGGDLEGIKQKIPYLKKLGVTALYLNPIFYAATVHKYDCLDYFTVDPHFGGDKALEDLTQELHKNGMKIILDVSINHTGIANKWFNRDGTFFPKSQGAYNNPDSEEREYYFFNKDNTYKAWFNVATLPTLNYTSQKLRDRLYRDKDSLVKKWLKAPYNIDGWRFDVADVMARNDEIQLHHEVWPEIRKSIKEENKDAYILAEDWSDCSEFLNGNEWDSTMNYFGSCRPIRQFFGLKDVFASRSPEIAAVKYKMTAQDFAQRITQFANRLPFAVRQMQFNLLDSHDVSRLHNDPKATKEIVKGSAIILFTLPGCTNMYYGDEAEIDGRIGNNEGCRYPMPWNKNIESTSAYSFYHKLIELKTKDSVFSDGGFKILWAQDYVIAYARFDQEKIYYTVCSSDFNERKIELALEAFGTQFKELPAEDIFGQKLKAKLKNGKIELTVPAGKNYLFCVNA
jgi:alpha-glucosidase